VTTCGHCGRKWRSMAQAHCRAVMPDGSFCCEHFATNGIANLHWGSGKSSGAPSYNAKHLDPHYVSALIQDAGGVWHAARGWQETRST